MVVMDIFQPIVDLITEAIGTTLIELGTFWVGVPTEAVDDPNGPIAWLHGELSYLVFAVATVSVIIAGAKMAFSSRGEAARDVLRSLLTLIVVMLLGLSIIGLLVKAGDEFSKCMIASSVTPGLGSKDPAQLSFSDLHPPDGIGWSCEVTGETRKDFGANILAALGMTGPGGTALGIVGIMFIGIWAIMAAVIQIAMMVVRNGMLVVLIAVLPLAAAATNTETGRTWFKRCVSWLVAFLLYKPIAAFVYAAALRLMAESALAATSAENTGQFATALKNGITAAVMMTLAILALPALMKFLTPLVAATAGGAGLMAMTAQGAAGHQLVTAAHDDGSGDTGGPTGAAPTGSSQMANSASGRRGADGTHGATGQRGRHGGQGSHGGRGGQGQAQGEGQGQGQGQSQGQTGGGTATTTADAGSGGPGGSGGGGGSTGSGGSTGGPQGGHPYADHSDGSSRNGQGGSRGPDGPDSPDGPGPGPDGTGQDGGSTIGGPGGAGDLQPGQTGQGPGGAMDAADAVRKISKSVENMERTSSNVVDDAANEGPSGSY
jgi:hypothetical protein